jgi:hypothetical protein
MSLCLRFESLCSHGHMHEQVKGRICPHSSVHPIGPSDCIWRLSTPRPPSLQLHKDNCTPFYLVVAAAGYDDYRLRAACMCPRHAMNFVDECQTHASCAQPMQHHSTMQLKLHTA